MKPESFDSSFILYGTFFTAPNWEFNSLKHFAFFPESVRSAALLYGRYPYQLTKKFKMLRISPYHLFRMPLDPQDMLLTNLYCFNKAVSCSCGNRESRSHIFNCLMMEGIDPHGFPSVCPEKIRFFFHINRVCGFPAIYGNL